MNGTINSLIYDNISLKDWLLTAGRSYFGQASHDMIDFYLTSIKHAQLEFEKLKLITNESDQIAYGNNIKQLAINSYKTADSEYSINYAKLVEIKNKLDKWIVTEEFEKFKTDALNMITEELQDILHYQETTNSAIKRIQTDSDLSYFIAALTSAEEDVKYYSEKFKYQKEKIDELDRKNEEFKKVVEQLN